MNTRIAAATVALLMGVAAPVTSASAFDGFPRRGMDSHFMELDRDDLVTGSLGRQDTGAARGHCAPSPGAEGNANMQAQAFKNYGGVSGGYLCR